MIKKHQGDMKNEICDFIIWNKNKERICFDNKIQNAS